MRRSHLIPATLVVFTSLNCGGRVGDDALLVDGSPGGPDVLLDVAYDDTGAGADDTTWIIDTGTVPDTALPDLGVIDPKFTDLRIDPSFEQVEVGKSVKFTLYAVHPDGTAVDVSTAGTWSLGDPTAGKIAPDGTLYGIKNCSCALTATYGGRKAIAKVGIWDWHFTAVAIDPGTPGIYIGDSAHLVAQATWVSTLGEIKVVAAPTSAWTVGPGSDVISMVLDKYPYGATITGKAAGAATVTVTYHGMTGTSKVTVTDHSLTGLDVSPYAATIFPGGIANLVATVRYKDGTSSDVTSTATWSSSDDKIVTVKGGNAVGVAPGSVKITATALGKSGTSTITVTAPGTP